MPRLTKSLIDRLEPGDKDLFHFCSELRGFGLKVTPRGSKTFIVTYRVGRGRNAQKPRETIGRYGSPWTVDQARDEAKRILALAARGEDPREQRRKSARMPTIAELCDLYLDQGVSTKKTSTIGTDVGRIQRHIKPLLGHVRVDQLTRGTAQQFLNDVASGKTAKVEKTGKFGVARVTGGKGTATRTLGLLGGIMSFAVDQGYIETNPVTGVKRFKDKAKERYLTESETRRLGEALANAETDGTNLKGIQIIRLLMLTGCRRGEIEKLKWSEVDLDRGWLRLSDTKEGESLRPLSNAAAGILEQVERTASDHVFPAERGSGHYVGTPKIWRQVRAAAGLPDVRIHDLRHTVASFAVSSGSSLPMVAKMLGHKDSATTKRYAHLHDDPLKGFADQTAKNIERLLGGGDD